jgi:hypothetical protein
MGNISASSITAISNDSTTAISTPDEPSIYVGNSAGDYVAFHKHNTRKAHCVECRAELAAGHGVQRKVRNFPGSGYLCHVCAGNAIITHQNYMLNRWTSTLSPFDGVYSCYAIPSAELAQAFHDHGAAGLLFAAQTLREKARAEFLNARNIPFTPEKINNIVLEVAA